MKKYFALTALAALMAVAITSCKSSSGGHCDAYGSADQIENSDLAAK